VDGAKVDVDGGENDLSVDEDDGDDVMLVRMICIMTKLMGMLVWIMWMVVK
jgi:hypothetical protein